MMARFISDALWWVLALTGSRRVVNGVDVRVVASEAEASRVFVAAEAAFRLIEVHDGELLMQMKRNVRMVLFTEAKGGEYLAGLRTVRIGIGYAERVLPLDLAMMIVHESTHAMLAAAGESYQRENRDQVESRCVEAEVSFAKLVPDSTQAVAKAERLLESRWWDTSVSVARSQAELLERGIPAWLVKLIVRRAMWP